MRKKARERRWWVPWKGKRSGELRASKSLSHQSGGISNLEEAGKLLFCSKRKTSSVFCRDWQTTPSSGMELFKSPEKKHVGSIIVWYVLATPDRACLSRYFPEGKKDKLAQQGTLLSWDLWDLLKTLKLLSYSSKDGIKEGNTVYVALHSVLRLALVS